jgi:hypothetical protein
LSNNSLRNCLPRRQGDALLILVEAGCLADEHQHGIQRPHPRHGVRASHVQRALLTAANLRVDGVQGLLTILVHRVFSSRKGVMSNEK